MTTRIVRFLPAFFGLLTTTICDGRHETAQASLIVGENCGRTIPVLNSGNAANGRFAGVGVLNVASWDTEFVRSGVSRSMPGNLQNVFGTLSAVGHGFAGVTSPIGRGTNGNTGFGSAGGGSGGRGSNIGGIDPFGFGSFPGGSSALPGLGRFGRGPIFSGTFFGGPSSPQGSNSFDGGSSESGSPAKGGSGSSGTLSGFGGGSSDGGSEPVPEPSGIALLGIGAFGLFAYGRKRKRSA